MSNLIHGMRRTPLYTCWKAMKQRCYNKKQHDFHYYGGRGITVCDEWCNNSKAFFDWAMANGYRPDLQIDRIDNNGNYEPSNCRFVTCRINSSNIRKKSKLPTGVQRLCRKYRAKIRLDGRNFHLGLFATPEEAGKTYSACVEAFGV